MGRVVLVTGVARDLGRRFAARLATERSVERVIGVDVTPPRGDLGRVQFVRADIRQPVIAKVIVREDVDTVVHLGVRSAPAASGGRSAMKELNVIGTMQLLAACQRAPELRHLVVRSSTAVYGSSNRDPAMFTEDMGAKRVLAPGFAKDVTEVEGYVRGFARRRPDVRVTLLRTADVLGPSIGSPLADYLRLPVVPTVMGFDARLQLLHEHDLVESLVHAGLHDVPGTFNVAGEGVMVLSQVLRRLGRPRVPVPAPAVGPVGSLVRQARLADFSPEQASFLAYGRGVDTSRLRTVLGYHPQWTTERTVAEFGLSLNPGLLAAARLPHPVADGGSPAVVPSAPRGTHDG